MRVFSKLKNPKALYRQDDMHNLYMKVTYTHAYMYTHTLYMYMYMYTHMHAHTPLLFLLSFSHTATLKYSNWLLIVS